MYVYFDNNGVLKEIITERPFRVGDSQRDKIYIYWEGEHTPTAGWVKYRKADGTFTTETSITLTQVNKTLPTDPLQNLKYFSYEHTYTDGGVVKVGYPFYQLTVPSEVLTSAVSGDLIPTSNNMCAANVRFVFSDSSIDNLGVIVFSVETSIGILTDNSISETQYNYLIAEISQKFGIDNLRSVKVDELPETGETGTIYYVKIENEEVYNVYFWNALTAAFVFMGTTACGLYTQEEGSAFESEVNDRLDEQDDRIATEMSSITSPTYYTSLPTSNVGLIVYSDGYLYSWNGTEYVSTGIQYLATGNVITHKGNQLLDENSNKLYPNLATILDNWVSSYAFDLSGTTVDINNPLSSSNYDSQLISCNEGDVFDISTRGGSTSRAFGFVDSLGNILLSSPTTYTITNFIVVAPKNSAYLIVNNNKANTSRIVYKGISNTHNTVNENDKLFKQFMPQKINNNNAYYYEKMKIANDGGISIDVNYALVHLIPVESGKKIYSNYYTNKIVEFNENQVVVSTNTTNLLWGYTLQSSTKYISLQFAYASNPNYDADKLVISYNANRFIENENELYIKGKLDGEVVDADNLQTNTITRISNKNDWELGSISSDNGNPTSTADRIRTKNFISIEEFVFIKTTNYQIKFFKYDENFNYIGTVAYWFYGKINSNVFNSNVKYLKFIANITSPNLGNFDSYNITLKLNEFKKIRNIVENSKLEDITNLNNSNFKYIGEKIDLNNYFYYENTTSFGGGQGGCHYGDYMFRFNTDNTFKVYKISTKELIGTFTLDGNLSPHCNMACFGTEFYDSDDEFPLVYVNAYNNTSLPLGTLYAFRMVKTDNTFTSTLIQTISIGFTNNSIWSNGDYRPYGNFVIDTDKNYLYAYVPRDTINKTRFFKFELPILSDGSSITLNTDDILEQFDTEFVLIPQDNCYYNGKIYICSGLGTSEYKGYIKVIDLIKKSQVSVVNLSDALLTFEPEAIDIFDKNLYCGAGSLYKFKF